MTEFRETIVLSLRGSVIWEMTFIMMGGLDRIHQDDFSTTIQKPLQQHRHHTLRAIAAVVGGDEHFVADAFQQIFADQETLVWTENCNNAVARLLEGSCHGIACGNAEATPYHNKGAVQLLDVCRIAPGPTTSRI